MRSSVTWSSDIGVTFQKTSSGMKVSIDTRYSNSSFSDER